MSRRKKPSGNFKEEMKKRERLAEKIFEDCEIEIPYLTWANMPSRDLKAFYEENRLDKGMKTGDLVKAF